LHMPRPGFLILATVIAVTAVSGLVLYSKQTPKDDARDGLGTGTQSVPREGVRSTNLGAAGDFGRTAVDPLTGSGPSETRVGSRGSGEVGPGSIAREVRTGLARSAQTVTDGAARHGGTVGVSGAGSRPSVESGAISVSTDAEPKASLGRGGSNSLELSAGQSPPGEKPPETDNLAGQGHEGATKDGDVLLSVPLNGTTRAEDLTPPIVEENVKPAEGGDGVQFPGDSVLQFPGVVKADGGTISLDVEPNWNGSDPGDNHFVEVRTPDMAGMGRLSIFRNGGYLRFVIVGTDGLEYNIGTDITAWASGDSHTITATWGESLMSMYLDGQLVGQKTYPTNPAIPPDMPLYLGSLPHEPGAEATLRNFKVYGRPLTPDEIAPP
jgi:hypothetical protein